MSSLKMHCVLANTLYNYLINELNYLLMLCYNN